MKTTWHDFANAVTHAGLVPKSCLAGDGGHWQITGGEQMVNVWPNTKRGFVMAAGNGRGRFGSVAKAIKLAGPPKTPKPQAEHEYPASVPDAPFEERMARMSSAPEARKDATVGLIRWLWRWIW